MQPLEAPARPVAQGTRIGHVHLKVADLERMVAFYRDVLGFTVTQRFADYAAFLSDGTYHHALAFNTIHSRGGEQPAAGSTGLFHLAILYPDRAGLADGLRRVEAAGVTLTGASDHGVSEALYFDDPEGNGVELYVDRPVAQWPLDGDGRLAMGSEAIDLDALRALGGPGDA